MSLITGDINFNPKVDPNVDPLLAELEKFEAEQAAKANEVDPLLTELEQFEQENKPKPSAFDTAIHQGYKTIVPEWIRENTPIGAVLNTMSGYPQAMIDTANLVLPHTGGSVPSYLAGTNQPITDSKVEPIPDFPLIDPEASDVGRIPGEWMAPLPGAKFNKVADPIIGISAGIGDYIGEMYDNGWGETIGGITGILATLLKRKPKESLESATDFMASNLTDVSKTDAINSIKNSGDEVGTFADIVQDRGAMKVENAASAPGTLLQDSISDITKARNAQIVDETGKIITGEGDSLLLAQQRQNELANKVTNRIGQVEDQAIDAADQIQGPPSQYLPAHQDKVNAQVAKDLAIQKVESPYKPSEASKQLSETVTTKHVDAQLADDGSKQAYKAFDSADPITAQQFKDSVVDWADANLTLTEATMLKNKFGQTLNLIDNLEDVIKPKEVQSIISEIKRINNNASQPGGEYTSANKFLAGVQDALEKQLENVDETGNLYTAARNAYAKEQADFNSGRLGKARSLQEKQTFGRSLFDTNEGGAAAIDDLLTSKDPDIFAKAEEYVKSLAQRERGKGLAKEQTFLDNYDELLDRFPTLKPQLLEAKAAAENFVASEKALDVAQKADTEADKVLKKTIAKEKELAKQKATDKTVGLEKALSKSEMGKFRNDPVAYLDKALSQETLNNAAPEALTKLAKQFAKVEGGTDALRSAIRERFIKKINNPKGKNPTVDLKSVSDFHGMKHNLISSGILTKDEVIEIEKLMDKAEFSGFRKSLGQTKLNKADEILADIGSSAAAIAALHVLPASNQLMLANTVKRIFKQRMGGSGADKETLLALESIIKNPEKFLEGIASQKVTSNDLLTSYIDKFIRGTSKSVAADEENKEE